MTFPAQAPLAGRTFEAVLFDLDGTLIDSTASVDRSWARWARTRGLDRASFDVAHGVPTRQILATFLPAGEVDGAAAEIEAMEVADADGIVVLPGALEALAALPAGRCAIATSCTHALALARIAATGLPVPAVVVTASDVAVGKPDPAPYLLAAARLGVDPARCLVVEDAPAGLESGRAAGCATLALGTTHPVGQLRADAVVGTLADVTFAADGADGAGVRVQVHQPLGGELTGSRPVDGGSGSGIRFRSDVTVELVRAGAQDADVIFAARVSTQGEQSLEHLDDEAERSQGLINYLMRARHGSPFEHNSMTFYVQAPIFVFREFMRHRIASYNEESGRYRELRPVFYVPGPQRKLCQVGKPGHYEFIDGTPEQLALVEAETKQACTQAYAAYQRMLEAGVAREVARIVLPLTIYSSMYVTMNARSLMNFFSLRTSRPDARFPSYPQREIEMVAEEMEAHWARLMPLTHGAFEANGRVAP